MPAPTEKDVNSSGERAEERLAVEHMTGYEEWCYASLEEVKANLQSTGYPFDKMIFVKGKVEETIPQTIPSSIAILRLDTDWYESSYHELVHLFPRLAPYGVILLDDYSYWRGQREAVEKYLSENNIAIFFQRIDKMSAMAIKRM